MVACPMALQSRHIKTPKEAAVSTETTVYGCVEGIVCLPRLQNQFRSHSMIPYMQCRIFADYFTHGVQSLLWLLVSHVQGMSSCPE